jgi:hypothetical protein
MILLAIKCAVKGYKCQASIGENAGYRLSWIMLATTAKCEQSLVSLVTFYALYNWERPHSIERLGVTRHHLATLWLGVGVLKHGGKP